MKFELETFNRDVADDLLLQDLVAVHAKLRTTGERLTYRSYVEHGKYSASTINARFGTWNDGLRKAGIPLSEEKSVSTEALFDNLKVAWIARGKQPTYRDMSDAPSQYTGSTYAARFGGWRNALKQFVASVDHEHTELLSYEKDITSQKIIRRSSRDPTLALRFFVLRRDRFCCVACGRSPATSSGLVLEIDHIVPWSKGGETVEENLQTLCFACNRGKGVSQPQQRSSAEG